MSEHAPESSEDRPDQGLDGLQAAELDSVQGGGNIRDPAMDVEPAELDTIKKSEDPDGYETKEASSGGERSE